jgi:hypothetical protein
MKKSGAIFLLIFVIFIAFIYWYFIIRSPCNPMTKCYIKTSNISCGTDNDCFIGSLQGACDKTTFKCTDLILKGNKEECAAAEGEWITWGCLN